MLKWFIICFTLSMAFLLDHNHKVIKPAKKLSDLFKSKKN
jgi:hypothetical protein